MSLRKINHRTNVEQKQNKSAEFENRREMIDEHLGFYEVGSQFSLRWSFQHALAWKDHARRRLWRTRDV
jgi:hypothetical protein